MIEFFVYWLYFALALLTLALLPMKQTRVLSQHILQWFQFPVQLGRFRAPGLEFFGWLFLVVSFWKYVHWHMKFIATTVTGTVTLETKTQRQLSKWIHERETYSYALLSLTMLALHVIVSARALMYKRTGEGGVKAQIPKA